MIPSTYEWLVEVHYYTILYTILLQQANLHCDKREERAVNNLIPTSTGFTKAIVEIFPKLKGKIDGMAVRAPVIDGSLIDFVVNTKKSTNIEELNKLFLNASKSSMKEILEYSTEELVSTDIIGNSKSCVFDSKLTKVNGNFIKVTAWYDNECGYSNRIIDLIKYIDKLK